MTVSELRIGNYLTFKGNSRVNVKLDRFDLSAILYNEDEVLHYEPIVLTEEILLKCGFEKVRYEKYAHKKINKLRAYPHVMKDGFGIYLMGSYTLPNIKHLHQLQNLYWCLCEKELEIQL